MDDVRMKQNLYDAGCDEAVMAEILELYQQGRIQEALLKMKKDRCRLMDQLHESGRKVDCMDYLIRKTEKELRTDH
ncbi:MAG: hypothetical protein IIZ74_03525 [Erysipelotrichaceae bacterium]|nr:hypothetical protein [Erysipelotrichaceae bacterium]